MGQIWRGGRGKQAPVSLLLGGTEVAPLDEALGRRAGVLSGKSRARDVVDAALVLLAEDGDTVLTSDPRDLRPLAAAAGLHVDLSPV